MYRFLHVLFDCEIEVLKIKHKIPVLGASILQLVVLESIDFDPVVPTLQEFIIQVFEFVSIVTTLGLCFDYLVDFDDVLQLVDELQLDYLLADCHIVKIVLILTVDVQFP